MARRSISIAFVLLVLAGTLVAAADADPLVVMFHEEGCLDCEDMMDLLRILVVDDFDVLVAQYEYAEPESGQLLSQLCEVYNIDVPDATPILFVNDRVFVGGPSSPDPAYGYGSIESALSDTITRSLRSGYESPIARLPQVQLQRDLPRLALFLAAFLALAWLQLH